LSVVIVHCFVCVLLAASVVGDEMLSGKVEDINTPLCRELHKIGWTVRKVRLN
jgi:molybdopterin-biosynthesis enzyme MoeA-like protein